MAKTTGSRPVLIYPGGQEQEIRRRGRANVLEQEKLVARPQLKRQISPGKRNDEHSTRSV